MEIIKQGNISNAYRPLIFSCSYCGCVFKATSWEYTEGMHYGWETCTCPCCGRTVYCGQQEYPIITCEADTTGTAPKEV